MSDPARLEAKNFYCDAHAAYDCQCLQEFQDQLVTLTKERDHLRERLAQSEATWKGVCDHLESWLTAMREALRKYGEHRLICAVSKIGSPCTCGLAEALTSQ